MSGLKPKSFGPSRTCANAWSKGGFVAGAIVGGTLVGFANVENTPLGSRKQYLELRYIHVSREYRGQGLGRQLFRLCCEGARQRRAEKLYIGAHPAVETQAFYAALGCVLAEEVVPEILALEPRDLQLEYILHGGNNEVN